MERLKIAVTGGIGSGKSVALAIIEKLGYKTVSFDEIYSDLLNDEKFVMEICEKFSVMPLLSDNGKKILDRKALSEIVFKDKNALKKLNDFTHGRIFEKAFSLYRNEKIVFYEVPLLFEGNYQGRFDKVFVIMRDKEERIKSAAMRDDCPPDKIIQKINSQINYDNSDFSLHTIIVNDGDLEKFQNKIAEEIRGLAVER